MFRAVDIFHKRFEKPDYKEGHDPIPPCNKQTLLWQTNIRQ
jgi:hypothetical protein